MQTIEKPVAVDRLVGINTAADTLGYSVSGIRKLIETGVLPVVRLTCDLIARYDREVSLIVPLPDNGHQVVFA